MLNAMNAPTPTTLGLQDRAAPWIIPSLIGVLVFLAALVSPVSMTGSDPFGLLVVSQNITQRAQVNIDPDREYFRLTDGTLHGAIKEIDGHYYHTHPIGVPLISLPVVMAANALGLDMTEVERPMQKALAALTCASLVILLFYTARTFFSPGLSAVFALGVFFSTVLGSTLPSALWTLNYEAVMVAATLLFLIRHGVSGKAPFPPFLLGVVLFLGFLCRPTMAPLIAFTLLYCLMTDRRLFLRVALPSAFLLSVFVGWSWATFGEPVPPYYKVTRLGFETFPDALYGAFLGPSRNLLIFNPLFATLPFLALAARDTRPFGYERALWATAAAMLFVLLTFHPWWTGHGYGPRTTTGMALVLSVLALTLLGRGIGANGSVPCDATRLRQALRRSPRLTAGVGTLGLAFVLGGAVNLNGLTNPATGYWLQLPNVDKHANHTLNDWRFPQFLASQDSLVDKALTHYDELDLPISKIVPIRGRMTALSLNGTDIGTQRTFRVPISSGFDVHLRVAALMLGPSQARVLINGTAVGTLEAPLLNKRLKVPAHLLQPDRDNTIALKAGDARGPALVHLEFALRSE